ncbi:MCP four helix bundle domain-containing protein, partial [Jeotgalibaca porci]|uniref:CHASE3 domain-containing protein n=1 Tax=Jeotgalibaca porci TaxID=1868793 RepID=UPI00359F355C
MSEKLKSKKINFKGKWQIKNIKIGKFAYSDLKIKQRLLLAFSVIMLFMTVIGATSLYTFQQTYSNVDEMVSEDISSMKIYDNVNYYSARRLAAVRGYFLTSKDSYVKQIDEYTELMNIEKGKILAEGATKEIETTFQELSLLDVVLEEQLTSIKSGGSRGEALRIVNT